MGVLYLGTGLATGATLVLCPPVTVTGLGVSRHGPLLSLSSNKAVQKKLSFVGH